MHWNYSGFKRVLGYLLVIVVPWLLPQLFIRHFSKAVLPAHDYHSINDLIEQSEHQYQDLLRTETKTYSAAYEAYVALRGQRPPPGFRQWFELAKKKSVIVIESFWDQIYEDLEPFWSISPRAIRRLSFALAHAAGQVERVYGIWIRIQTVHTNCLDDD